MNAAFDAGRESGWDAVAMDDRTVGDPQGVEPDYLEGWWFGVYEAQAWLDGWAACQSGLLACVCDRDDDEAGYADLWKAGYAAAMACMAPRMEARRAA